MRLNLLDTGPRTGPSLMRLGTGWSKRIKLLSLAAWTRLAGRTKSTPHILQSRYDCPPQLRYRTTLITINRPGQAATRDTTNPSMARRRSRRPTRLDPVMRSPPSPAPQILPLHIYLER